MDEIEKTQQQVAEAMKKLDQEQPKQEMVPVHIISAWGNQQTPGELRGYATSIAFLTPEQINGEFRFLLTQFLDGISRLNNQNQPQ